VRSSFSFLDVEIFNGPNLLSSANMMATVLSPDIAQLLPMLGRISKFPKASTFVLFFSPANSFTLSFAYILHYVVPPEL
jgi:hypothetical protein